MIRLCGKDVDGAFVVAGLAILPELLPENHPSKQLATDFTNRYEKQYGKGSRNQFTAHGYDAYLLPNLIISPGPEKSQTRHSRIPHGIKRRDGIRD